MKRLRLLVTGRCNRSCPGCCNTAYDLSALPVCEDLSCWDEIILTGGEPLLELDTVLSLISTIRKQNPKTLVYIYTAVVSRMDLLMVAAIMSNGLTITLHDQDDFDPFYDFMEVWFRTDLYRSMRLRYVKGEIDINDAEKWHMESCRGFKVDEFEWREPSDCPVPEGEVFMRFSGAV